ncbi:MAG: hypothetical protein E7529_06980 [Ruminococcaceae bacterium]|nr:hypothetical protein [Oscillospiraceae bacterium]
MKAIKIIFSLLTSAIIMLSLAVFSSALHGDVNYDEYIGIEDAVIALRFATNIETPDEHQEHSADLDYDGIITTNDVRLILRGAADMDYVPDHFFSNWETIKSPNCIEDGIAESVCYYCEKKVTKTLNKTGHIIVDATCDTGSYCSVCNETFGEPLEHIENEGYCINCNTLLSAPTLSYNNKEIKFGCSTSKVKSILGEPQGKGKDSVAEKTVVMYAYYTDYKDLAIFTFFDGKLTQFFSNATTAIVAQGSSHYGLYCKSAPEKIGDIDITTYSDTFNNEFVYSFCATVGESYSLTKTTDYSLIEKINFHLTNGLRAINGVAPLKYCSDAAEVAQAHSNDMAKRNFFDHTNPDGKRVSDRLTAGGVEWYACAENIAAGVYDPYALSNGWYNSEGHRKIILNAKYKYIGVGFAYSEKSNYKYYSTQNFYTDEY